MASSANNGPRTKGEHHGNIKSLRENPPLAEAVIPGQELELILAIRLEHIARAPFLILTARIEINKGKLPEK